MVDKPRGTPRERRFIVDQDITPDWFDKKECERTFREAVCAWWKNHVLVDQKIDELNSGFYRLKRCEVKKLCNDVRVLWGSSQVGEMWGSSQVGKMCGSSQVGKMLGSSQVGEMWDSSTTRDFKNYPNIIIWISEEGKFEIIRKKSR